MRTKLKRAITADDLAKLTRLYRQMQDLTIGLHPSAIGAAMLMASLAVVRQTLVEWAGDPAVVETQVTPSQARAEAD